ncbi:UNKNOWN [Stylonychia lemnae]|uniref:Cyclic nucleotide-binding domain-containing protein n=1 Tax=Stylonychia lemnae TaxID=5949 RepID=A0A078AGU9_STYLE|nr:UNKNOWN [Stylonychia lemnae]|eukprot:CDW81071.1 UNKNOWN [Stylonychia lemnae]
MHQAKSFESTLTDQRQSSSPKGRPARKQQSTLERILNKPQKNRTDGDLEKLVPLIKQIEFFIERDVKDSDFTDIVSCLTYEFKPSGKDVFEYGIIIFRLLSTALGSIGEKFYIILQGTVSVMIPNPDIKDFKKRYEEFMYQKQKGTDKSSDKSQLELHHRDQRKNTLKIEDESKMQEMKLLLKNKQQEWASTMRPSGISNDSLQKFNIQENQIDLSKKSQGTLEIDGELSETYDQENEDLIIDNQNSKIEIVINNEEKQPRSRNRSFKKVKSIKEDLPPLFSEFTQLKAGKSFGELALIKNKPRAATIKCTEDCHFAVMSKTDYEKVLQKIELKKMQKIIDFLHQLPFFKVWTKTSLGKLHYSFEERLFKRNQVVYREGDASEMVYIIKSGEFEVTKRFVKQTVREIDVTSYIGPKANQKNEQELNLNSETTEDDSYDKVVKNGRDKSQKGSKHQVPQIQLASRLRNTETFKILLLGPGQMFGEDDVVHERPYSQTIICRSNTGLTFAMRANEFFRKLKSNEECWKIILNQVLQKDNQMRSRMLKIDQVFHKEITNPIVDGNSSQSRAKQVQYPNILQKHNLKVTQKRLDDFRETIGEIIKKQKNEGLIIDPNEQYASILQSQSPVRKTEQELNDSNQSPSSKTINKSTFIAKPNKISLDQSPEKQSVITIKETKKSRNQLTPDITSKQTVTSSNNFKYMQSIYNELNTISNPIIQQINPNSSQYQESNIKIEDYDQRQAWTSQNYRTQINRTMSVNSRPINELTRQRIIMMKTSQQKFRANQINQILGSSAKLGGVVGGGLSQMMSGLSPMRSQVMNHTINYEGRNQYMSVAHTLKPTSQSILSSIVAPHLSNQVLAPHIAQKIYLKNKLLSIQRGLTGSSLEESKSRSRSFMNKRMNRSRLQQDRTNLNQTINAGFMPNAYIQLNKSSSDVHQVSTGSTGIQKFTNEQIQQQHIEMQKLKVNTPSTLIIKPIKLEKNCLL